MMAGWVLRVRDKQSTPPHALIGVQRLLRCVFSAVPDSESLQWAARRGAWGWGEYVCSLEDALGSQQSLPIEIPALLEALDAGEYFNHVELDAEEAGLSVAVVDSTFLQLTGPRDVVEECRDHFDEIEVIPPSTEGPGRADDSFERDSPP